MTHRTHVTLSLNFFLLIMIALVAFIGITLKSVALYSAFFGVVLGSLIPDIDEPESYIGKKLFFVSILVKSISKHRGFTHYLIFPIIFLCVTFFFDGLVFLFFLGISFGILMHIIGDLLTLGGIKNLLFPFGNNKKYYALLPKKLRFKTNSYKENILYLLLTFLLFFEVYLYFQFGGFF